MKERPNEYADKEELLWMKCTQCPTTAVQNDTGICRSCSGEFNPHTQPDSFSAVFKAQEKLRDL